MRKQLFIAAGTILAIGGAALVGHAAQQPDGAMFNPTQMPSVQQATTSLSNRFQLAQITKDHDNSLDQQLATKATSQKVEQEDQQGQAEEKGDDDGQGKAEQKGDDNGQGQAEEKGDNDGQGNADKKGDDDGQGQADQKGNDDAHEQAGQKDNDPQDKD